MYYSCNRKLASTGQCDPQSPPPPDSSIGGLQSKKGTSYAAAVVAGSAALVRQYFMDGYYPSGEKKNDDSYEPTGSLMKAVLMHGAQFLNGVQNEYGQVSTVSPYDNTQNFGRISLTDSLYLKQKEDGKRFHIYDELINYNEVPHVYELVIDTISLPCNTDEFRVTLVWTDPPALSGCTHCLINDLDLVVRNKESGLVYFPNGKSEPDVDNNAERVIVNNVRNGDIFQISVIAKNLAFDTQRYSLVISGCVERATNKLENPPSVPEPSTYVRTMIAIFVAVAAIGLCCCIGVCFVEGARRKGILVGARTKQRSVKNPGINKFNSDDSANAGDNRGFRDDDGRSF